MRAIAIVTLMMLMLVPSSDAAADQPHYYMLLEPGNERWYDNVYGGGQYSHTLVVGYQDGMSIIHIEQWVPEYWERDEAWLMDAEGDVYNCGYADDPNEPQLFLDVPLEAGKTWGETWGQWDQYYHIYTVAGEEDVSTPLGLLTCIRVDWRFFDGSAWEEHTGYYHFADGYGLIDSYYCDGFHVFYHYMIADAVIGTRALSWSGIKQLFR